MTYRLRKIQLALTAVIMSATASMHGSDYNTISNTCYPQECAPEYCSPCSCGEIFIGAELLYLRAYQGGIADVCDGTQTTDTIEGGILVSTLTGSAHDPDFNWDLGYRVGVGYEFADSHCGIGAFWTHFKSHNGDENNTNENRWNIDLDIVDVLYGCECNGCNCFVFTPFAGIRYANIHQSLHTNFLGSIDGVTSRTRGHLREEFYGVGPVFGVDGDWGIGCGFSLYGNISAGVLYGRFHVTSHETDVFSTGININDLSQRILACQGVLDTAFGVRWKTCFCCDKELLVQLGVEQHRYFNHNQFCGYGDLSLDGVSLAVGIEF